MCTSLTNTHTSRSGLQDEIGNGLKETSLNYLTTFWGLNLTPNVDQFLYSKISKKLDYWSIIKLSLMGRVIICNKMLLSTL